MKYTLAVKGSNTKGMDLLNYKFDQGEMKSMKALFDNGMVTLDIPGEFPEEMGKHALFTAYFPNGHERMFSLAGYAQASSAVLKACMKAGGL